MNRIAIISDIHANLPALDAVFEDLDTRHPEVVFCLGDLVDFAPWPNEVIDAIRLRRIPTLMGNHDERIALDLQVCPLAKHSPEEQAARVQAIEYTRAEITLENRRYLAGLTKQLRISFEGTEILLVHASTRNIDEYVYEDHPEDDLQEMFQSNNADVIVMGHTHLPYVRSIGTGGKFALNAGSVGRSKERSPLASYLMLTITGSELYPEIVRVPYCIEDTIRAIRESEIPNFYAEFLLARTDKRLQDSTSRRT